MTRIALSAILIASVAWPMVAGAAEPNRCLRWVDIVDLTRVNDVEAVATTKGHETFVLKFAARCDFQRFADSYFVVEPQQRLSCVTPQDIFRVHNGTTCEVERIEPKRVHDTQ